MPWIDLLVAVYRLIYMYVLTQVCRPCRDVIFHVWLKQTIRLFLPCKFTAECTNKRIFIILEVGIFQNQNCDLVSVMVCHLPAIWSVIFQVLHFPVFDLFWSVIFRSCKFSAPERGRREGRGSLGRGRREEEWIDGINLPHGRLKTLAALCTWHIGQLSTTY